MDIPLRKVTARVDLKAGNTFVRPQPRSRPGSPTKQSPTSSLSPPSFRPKAKVDSNATVRKLSSSSSLSASPTNNVAAPSRSRPGSPLRPSRMLANGSEHGGLPKARITARPTSRSGMSPVQTHSGSIEQSRQRALTTASAKLKLPHFEDRPRSGSVFALHHALSISDLNTSSSPTHPQSPLEPEPPLVDIGRTNTPPILAPIKIKSKVTGLVKSMPTNPVDLASRSLSPPYATTRPIHTRARTPSITSSFSLNDPPSSVFYPITTASPAANPHRYVPRRALSPARSFPSANPSERSPPCKEIAPSAQSGPGLGSPTPTLASDICALTLFQIVGFENIHISESRPNDRQPNLERHAEIIAQTKRDRSRSKERSPRDLVHQGDSDAESDGSERQLRAEAKTNRKIADLEITNRSLLAINASLETTKNRQAKEIRDLRRKLRESRLILPPRTYKVVRSALEEERDREDEDEDEDEDDSDVEEGLDETFQRVRGQIDSLIESGKRALETRPEDFRANLATKVLNADELRSWRDSGQRTFVKNGYVNKQDAEDETIHSHLSPALVAMLHSGGTSCDEELTSNSRGSSALPPITITHSL
ncbi:hypothetical protein J3R83DRAFT_6321 [Lanmaoa asiatica]|nr:hypothetical protein J3R83DRAFT_6321 [Lanmaoa asiatica]